MTVLVDGEETPIVDAGDRGLHYGDGLFETMLLTRGRVPLLDRHLARLAHGSRRLGIPWPGEALFRGDVDRLSSGEGVIKIVWTRGSGGRGYAPPREARPRRIVSRHPRADAVAGGLAVIRCQTRLASGGPLAGLKHLGRLEQVLGAAEVQAAGADDGLMSDEGGAVVEGTRGNLFLVAGGDLVTPPLSGAGVAGVMRQLVRELAEEEGVPVHERPVSYAHVEAAEAIFLTNAVAGIQPVRRLAGLDRELAVDHPVVMRLLAAVRQELESPCEV